MPEVDTQKYVKSRPPARVVRGEDFPIVRDEVTYYPHAGEEVRFIGEPSNGFTQDLVRLAYLLKLATREESGMLRIEDGEELERLFESIRLELEGHIQSWTWTDSTGRELPEHPTVEDLRTITLAELMGLGYALIPD